MFRRIICFVILFISVSFSQTDSEKAILVEIQNLVGYIDQFQKINDQVSDFDFKVTSGVAHSVARSVNIAMNAYHLIHIQSMIRNKDDKAEVSNYVMKQLPNISRLLKIESKMSSELLNQCKNDQIINMTKDYLTSLLIISTTLDSIKLT